MIKFAGNCPASVKKDAKYHIRKENGSFVVGISLTRESGEYWTPTTTEHPELVKMVNQVKKAVNMQEGGAFYINEFRQVIVPAGEGYYLAGEYHIPLTFTIHENGENVEISGKAVKENGTPLEEGEEWTNCLMGIPYVLCAGGKDIRFEIELGKNHFRRIPLSKVTDRNSASRLAARLCSVLKNSDGGRFYINDMREMFKPVTSSNGYVTYIYLGRLSEDDPWFPKELFMED